MNYLQLSQWAAEEVNQRPLDFTTVSQAQLTDPFERRVVRAVQSAYRDIVQLSRHWRFFNMRGELLKLKEGQAEYTLCGIQSIDWNSLYLTREGTSARWPVWQQSYAVWQMREQASPSSKGVPLELIRTPDPDTWLVWPTPTRDFNLNGNAQIKPGDLTLNFDTPCWDSEFHDIVALLAVMRLEGRVATRDEVVSELNTKTARQAFLSRWDPFCRQYLPEFISAPTLF